MDTLTEKEREAAFFERVREVWKRNWKEPTFRERIYMWIAGVIKIRCWTRMDIDEYMYILYRRKTIQDALEHEVLDERMKANLDEADETLRSLTKETEKSVLYLENSSSPETKEKYWFAYRLLESKYDEWLLYAYH